MLAERYCNDRLEGILRPADQFRPFPTASRRDAWDALPDSLRSEYVLKGEAYLDYLWLPLTATLYMDYKRKGNDEAFGKRYFDRRLALICLTLAECMEAKGRFTDQIINGIWAICEETFWGTSAHNYVFKRSQLGLPDVTEQVLDLFAPETGGLLSWVCYLMEETLNPISPMVCERLRWEVKRRILEPFLQREDFWWMGYDKSVKINNWNPWVNMNCLAALLLLETDPKIRAQGVSKAMWMLDRFLDAYQEDGGCEEGTSYWAAGLLFNCLELLYEASGGRISLYDVPKVQNMGRFLYQAHIHEDYYIDFADGSARVLQAADLIHRYGKRIGDPKLSALGAYVNRIQKSERSKELIYKRKATFILDLLGSIFNYQELEADGSEAPYTRDAWLPGIQVMAAREVEGSCKGLYLAAKGGDNYEAHNHNDVGNFIVYYDGQPFIVDAGVGDYTAKTFSPQRYEIWTMQSAYHNLPTVNGVQQHVGKEFKAVEVEYAAYAGKASLSMDIREAYPKEAGIEAWKRTCSLERSGTPQIVIVDDFKLEKASQDVKLSLLTPCECTVVPAGVVLKDKQGKEILVETEPETLRIEIERVDFQDERMAPIWGDHLFRVLLSPREAVGQARWEMRIHTLEDGK